VPRHDFIYWTDDDSVAAPRYNDWKVTFLTQNAHGMAVWQQPFEQLRAPMLGNLRSDPYERAEYEGYGYNQWWAGYVHDRSRRCLRRAVVAELPRIPAAPEGASTSTA
jgi:arylsulfatase